MRAEHANLQRSGLLSRWKQRLLPAGTGARTVPFGLFRGLRLEIDFRCQTQLYVGLWERETYPYLSRAFERAAWLIDVGAGSGELALALLARRPEARAWAIEPDARCRAAITRNLGLNQGIASERLVVLAALAGAADGPGVMRLDRLPVLDGRPGLVKIDVDGAERDVLRGAEGLLSRRDVSWLVETHSVELEQDCLDMFSSHGLATTIILNAWWRHLLPEHRPGGHNRWIWACRR